RGAGSEVAAADEGDAIGADAAVGADVDAETGELGALLGLEAALAAVHAAELADELRHRLVARRLRRRGDHGDPAAVEPDLDAQPGAEARLAEAGGPDEGDVPSGAAADLGPAFLEERELGVAAGEPRAADPADTRRRRLDGDVLAGGGGDRLDHLRRRAETLTRLHAHQTLDDGLEHGREVREVEDAERHGAAGRAHADGDVRARWAAEVAEREQRHAQRVEIGAPVERAALDDLGGDEAERVARRQAAGLRAGDAKVHELDGEPAAAPRDEDVRRFQVEVHEAACVHVLEGAADLDHRLDELVAVEVGLAEVVPVDDFHGEGAGGLGVEVVDLDEVRVAEARQDLELARH